eukprot:TRINITY_DN13415_c0_g1_i1.p1 TRINITY_DN13415_c0_g1~~TRINITY_DN13415_c0_g1_i1.p1  ORF type:complete len:431 (+),score=46.58 TRINITY_DN13415_c0_g1_i1:96-1388(+)
MRLSKFSILGALLGHAGGVEEWRISPEKPVRDDGWQVTGLEFYSDDDCSQPVKADKETAYSGLKYPDQFYATEVLNAAKDCVDQCGGKGGFCSWCGEGNACCRLGLNKDPVECRRAVRFSSGVRHECVALFPRNLPIASRADLALDGSPWTNFQIDCNHGTCVEASPVLGAVIADESATVRCIIVVQPVQSSLWGIKATRASRRSHKCPGPCRSGRHLEVAPMKPCGEYVTNRQVCGAGEAYESKGTDCRECKKMYDASWEEGIYSVVSRQKSPDGKRVSVRLLQGGAPVRTAPLTNRGQDCIAAGHCTPGLCNWCGEGNACCKEGRQSDPPECQQAYGFSGADHYECVRVKSGLVALFDGLGLSPTFCALQVLVLAGLIVLWKRRSCFKRADDSNLTGAVFVPKPPPSGEDRTQMKKLREKTHQLDWVT